MRLESGSQSLPPKSYMLGAGRVAAVKIGCGKPFTDCAESNSRADGAQTQSSDTGERKPSENLRQRDKSDRTHAKAAIRSKFMTYRQILLHYPSFSNAAKIALNGLAKKRKKEKTSTLGNRTGDAKTLFVEECTMLTNARSRGCLRLSQCQEIPRLQPSDCT